MQDYRGNFKRIEFGVQQTPVKSTTNMNDFQSSQKLKYEQMSNKPQSVNVSFVNAPVTMVSKELFTLQIPVKVKQLTDDWNTQLTLKMIMQSNQQAHGQTLRIELTDDTNLSFLQILDLNEGEFLALKNEQSLHVDFATFPMKLADLLQLCINSQRDEKVNFYVSLETKNGESTLAVIENNEFKKLTHLSLRLRSATDDILKYFLANKLAIEQQENEQLYKKTKKLTEQLEEKQWELENLKSEVRKFTEDNNAALQQVQLDEQKKLNDFREQALSKETNFKRESENEKQFIIEKYEKIVLELQNKYTQLQQINQDLSEQKIQLTQQEKELKNKFAIIQQESQQLQKENSEFRVLNKELDTLKFNQERQIIELRIQKEGLEKILRDKEDFLNNKQQLVDNEKKQNVILEEQTNNQKKQIDKLEQRIAVMSDEVNKGNQIIEKLENELSKQKEKIKLKNAVVLQQEQTVQQLQDANDQSSKQINEQKDSLELKYKDQENTNLDLKNKLAESQKLLESNNQMIQYLNKCLNETKVQAPAQMPGFSTLKSQTFTKYTSPIPLQEDRSFRNQSVTYQQNLNNVSQISNATIQNKFNF
ncbi:unnamed protein product (macronuclear) [Paramecium tetraurelia]|uniref:Spindle assembly abnormal protein 6 N-terminal domain-containing protein n=1 Tax=Paramecium tetraurelia TaxID=5888 RepID=A0CLD4_PARTE|nr:uncharacterized protein GSPATT00008149001 [Paramecium tetraurelia]CAK71601.1 unnamed protein product [Paramecium tetraurelia]|eukprot:XP_001438998.1 hypothetical protein (macronuclear) [Paramecium tetraurelia strain d4-2]